MATTYNHIQLGVVDKNGNVNVLYPQNTADDVAVNRTSGSKIPSNVNDLQELVDSFGEMAFVYKKYMVFLGEGDEYSGEVMETEINDEYISEAYTWSSKKITNNTTVMINSETVKLSDLTALPISPRSIGIDGTLSTFSASCPASGYAWMMEYYPLVVEGNTVKKAIQKWTGISTLNAHVVYYRNYFNGSWGSYYQ